MPVLVDAQGEVDGPERIVLLLEAANRLHLGARGERRFPTDLFCFHGLHRLLGHGLQRCLRLLGLHRPRGQRQVRQAFAGHSRSRNITIVQGYEQCDVVQSSAAMSLLVIMMMMTMVMRGAGHHSPIAPSIGREGLRSAGQVQGRRLSTGPLGRSDAGAAPSGDPTINTDP